MAASTRHVRRRAVPGVDDLDEYQSHAWAANPQDRTTTTAARHHARANVTLVSSATRAGGAITAEAPLYLEDPTVYDRQKLAALPDDPYRDRARRQLVAQVARDYDYQAILAAELPGLDARRGTLAHAATKHVVADVTCQRRLARRELLKRLFKELVDEEARVAWSEATIEKKQCELSETALLQQSLINKRSVDKERQVNLEEIARARRREVNKARSARGVTPADLARVARARGLALSPDECRRVFGKLGPTTRAAATPANLRACFAAEAAGRGATRSLAPAEINWVQAAVNAIREDGASPGAAVAAANAAARRANVPVAGQRRWILCAKEWLDFESIPLEDFLATLEASTVCTSEDDLDRVHAALDAGAPSVQRAFVATFDFITPLVDELVSEEETPYFPLVDTAIESALAAVSLGDEQPPNTIFDARRLARDTTPADYTPSASCLGVVPGYA